MSTETIAIELFHEDGKRAGIFYCSGCRLVKRTHEEAATCCRPKLCACGSIVRQHYTQCDACIVKNQQLRERIEFEKAEKVTEWDGWIFTEFESHNEGYFSQVEDLFDYLVDNEVPRENWPNYVWTCEANPPSILGVDDFIEQIAEEGFEGIEDCIDGLEELEIAIKKFADANSALVTYSPNYKKALLVSYPIEEQK